MFDNRSEPAAEELGSGQKRENVIRLAFGADERRFSEFVSPISCSSINPRRSDVPLRVMTYNICRGGSGKEDQIAAVIAAIAPDLTVLQEATVPGVVERIAAHTRMSQWASSTGESLAFMSRRPVRHFEWHHPRLSRHAFLEIDPGPGEVRIFGLHLSALYSAWTERHRVIELRNLLSSIARHQHGFHLLAGDFNTLAPGDMLDFRKLPRRLRALVWLSGGNIRWKTIRLVLDAGYADAYRLTHRAEVGHTFPSWAALVQGSLEGCRAEAA